MSGYVYLMRAGGRFKIGSSTKPEKRREAIEKLEGEAVELVHVIRSAKWFSVEKALHYRFSASRIEGEWFSLPAADVALLLALERCDSPCDLPCELSPPPRTRSAARADVKRFASRLLQARLANNLTLWQLSRLSGVCHDSLQFLELGRRAPQRSTRARLAAALGCSAADL